MTDYRRRTIIKEMQFKSNSQILVDVLEACEWWERIRISTTGTRLQLIRRYLEELLNPGTTEDNPLGGETTQEDTFYALSDGAGFGLIAAEMRKLPSHLLPRRPLRDILQGPLAASKERPANSGPRNKFVELELAAHFSSSGFELLGFDDLAFEFDGCRYLVECKRPFHDGTLHENIEKAYKQLRGKLADSGDRGIVAFAVEKLFGLDKRLHDFESDSAADEFAVSIAQRFRDRIRQYERRWVDPRVVAVAAVIRFLRRFSTKEKKPPLICAYYELCFVKLASPQVSQATDSARLDRMVEKLRTDCLAT